MGRLVVLQLIAGVIGGLIASRKGRNMLFWALLCFLFPLLTIVIAVLPPLKLAAQKAVCPGCSRPLDQNTHTCRNCGWKRPIELVQCRKCGSFVPEHEDCPTCGKTRR